MTKYDLSASRPDPKDIKINNLTSKLSTVETKVSVLTADLQNMFREMNKMKNELGSMRRKYKTELQSLASKMNKISK